MKPSSDSYDKPQRLFALFASYIWYHKELNILPSVLMNSAERDSDM